MVHGWLPYIWNLCLDIMITQVEQDIRDACKNTEQSFAVRNGM